ncbi:HNH endonuclease [Priestia megaterium]
MWNFKIEKNAEKFILQRFKGLKAIGNPEEFKDIDSAHKKAEVIASNLGCTVDWVTQSEGREIIKCLYCNQPKPRPLGDGEHIFPKSLRAEVKTKKVCGECNQIAATKIDDPFVNTKLIKFIRNVYEIKKGKKSAPPFKETYTDDNGEVIQLTISGNKITLINAITKKEEAIKALKQSFSLENEEIFREAAKILLAATSHIVDGFRGSEQGQKLYDYAFENDFKFKNDDIYWDIKLPTEPFKNRGKYIKVQKGHRWNHHYTLKRTPQGYITLAVILFGAFKFFLYIRPEDDSYALFKNINLIGKRISISTSTGNTAIEGEIPGFEDAKK